MRNEPVRILWILGVLLVVAACGKSGLPLPPEPRGPLAARAVVARQVGSTVEVHFRVPEPRGPRPSQATLGAELLRIDYPPGLTPPNDPAAFRRRGVTVDSRDIEGVAAEGAIRLVDATLAELDAAAVGSTLRYAVRLRDRRGRLSNLAKSPDLVPLEPVPPPVDLIAEPTSDGVRVSWQAGAAADGLKYNLYRSLAGGKAPSEPLNPTPLSVTQYLDRDISMGSRYVYSVRRLLAEGSPRQESRSGEPYEVLAMDTFAPGPPSGLVTVQEGRAVRLFWDPSPELDLAGYRVYRSVNDGDWSRIGPDNLEQPTWVDTDVAIGLRVSYRVSAIDRATPPNESAPSPSVELELFAEPQAPSANDP